MRICLPVTEQAVLFGGLFAFLVQRRTVEPSRDGRGRRPPPQGRRSRRPTPAPPARAGRRRRAGRTRGAGSPTGHRRRGWGDARARGEAPRLRWPAGGLDPWRSTARVAAEGGDTAADGRGGGDNASASAVEDRCSDATSRRPEMTILTEIGQPGFLSRVATRSLSPRI